MSAEGVNGLIGEVTVIASVQSNAQMVIVTEILVNALDVLLVILAVIALILAQRTVDTKNAVSLDAAILVQTDFGVLIVQIHAVIV